ncbi:MAG: hypothetical protein QOF14_1123 [Hyphomicrobiales bacterium]|nr:hypothetical protein [Hyphomicrobiales bacterium]
MSGRLKELLVKDPLARRTQDYEAVYDDFIRYAGGFRIAERFNVPANYDNADYYVDCCEYDVILELKQVQKYLKDGTVDSYFNQLLATGQLQPICCFGLSSEK